MVCVSGGVSVGPHDHVKGALRELGVEERFWGVRLKPGKPTWFGVARRARSCSACPATRCRRWSPSSSSRARRCAPCRAPTPSRRARHAPCSTRPCAATRGASRRSACRLRADDDGWHADTTGAQGSHVLTSMLGADGARAGPGGRGRARRRRAGRHRAAVRPRDPRRLLGAAAARPARACKIVQVPSPATTADGSVTTEQTAEVTLPRARARPDLDPGVPRAPGAHLLALPHAGLARPAARALHRRLARDRGAHPAVRAAALPRARVRDQRRLRHGHLADRRTGCSCARAGAARATCGLGRGARARATAARARPPCTVTSEVANFYPRIAGWGWFARIGRLVYRFTQLRIHVIVTHAFLRSLARLDLRAVRRSAALSAGEALAERSPVISRSFARSWRAVTRRTVPERERMHERLGVAPSGRGSARPGACRRR